VLASARVQAQEQMEVDWQASATDYRGQFRKAFNVYCPPRGTAATVWGSGIYTDDSSICTAAVHALATFDFARGGTVYFAMEPSQEGYDAERRRGVTTNSYGFWDGGYRIVAGVPGKRLREITDSTPMEITWSTSARHLRGNNGMRQTMLCPRAGDNQPVWGSAIYTDDSSICAAAVHAGLITRAGGGGVTVRIEAGRDAYAGTIQNGVTSDPWERWEGSFAFPRGQVVLALPAAPDPVPEAPSARLGEVLVSPAGIAPAPLSVGPSGEFLVGWNTTATSWRGQDGRVISVYCPAGGSPAAVWGSGVYTDDSSLCTAAVHALATFDVARGGTVQLAVAPGQDSYAAEQRHGVSTSEWGAWGASFRVISGVPGKRMREIGDTTLTEISWLTTAQHLRGTTGVRRMMCPADGRLGAVWGSDVYSDHSSICSAAVHAGLITQLAGGALTVRIEAGRSRYAGTVRNGMTTKALGSWQGSFLFPK
jgi:hypothetical protein